MNGLLVGNCNGYMQGGGKVNTGLPRKVCTSLRRTDRPIFDKAPPAAAFSFSS
ncbi:hypothetical protein [Acidovorax sp. FJL06]|uniref:hypothetical protein n=1 Tax=Acidovorax sp. FJL06 TaxID=2153365 RepID=UPI0013150B49|nr:hypothetical protein [Acidovorax sp. FJL06]